MNACAVASKTEPRQQTSGASSPVIAGFEGYSMAMENPPFEDVFPIQDGDFPLLCLFTGG